MNDSAFKTEVIVSLETISLVKVFVLCGAIFLLFFSMKKGLK
ncbi:MAG TPA: hypothetical protein VL098_12660 [Flavipsychrobacter sp.]|nr:hypothetical protein [Flavipsychrobacter sp.]